MAQLIPVDHDPFETEPQGPWGKVGAAMPESYGADAPVQDVLARAIMSTAALPKRLIDANAESMQHTFGPGPQTMTTDELPWDQRDPLPGVSAEAAMTVMGGAGVVPTEANTFRMGLKAPVSQTLFPPGFVNKSAARVELNRAQHLIEKYSAKQRAWDDGGPALTRLERDELLAAFAGKQKAQQYLESSQGMPELIPVDHDPFAQQ
jgi:hypothetical protein